MESAKHSSGAALSATEFLSNLANKLCAESDDRDVAQALAEMIVDGLPAEEVIAKLNQLAAARCVDSSSDHG